MVGPIEIEVILVDVATNTLKLLLPCGCIIYRPRDEIPFILEQSNIIVDGVTVKTKFKCFKTFQCNCTPTISNGVE